MEHSKAMEDTDEGCNLPITHEEYMVMVYGDGDEEGRKVKSQSGDREVLIPNSDTLDD